MKREHTERITEVMQRVQQSDQLAFNQLFDMLWEPMYTYASSLLMSTSVAQDVVQEIWIDFWQRRETVDVQNVKSYLFKAIRYRCYNHIRDTKFNETQLEVAHSISISSEIEEDEAAAELHLKINRTLANLPNRCREIFELSRIHQISNKEIAHQLNISQRSVENQITHALHKLRKELAIARLFFF